MVVGAAALLAGRAVALDDAQSWRPYVNVSSNYKACATIGSLV